MMSKINWEEIFKLQEELGMTIADLFKGNRISVSSFKTRKYNKSKSENEVFDQVQIESSVCIEVNGVELSFSQDVDQ